MSQSIPLNLALVGNPNCGKTALFNRLTGARQKVANYAGVTVERKAGRFESKQGLPYRILDLPGTYGLSALTPDEAITRAVLLNQRADEAPLDLIVLVVDASKLQLNLKLVIEVLRLQRPTILALNMGDIARRRGIEVDVKLLGAALGIPVVETIAVHKHGVAGLVDAIDNWHGNA